MRVYATRNILYSRNRVQQIYGSISGRNRNFRVHMIFFWRCVRHCRACTTSCSHLTDFYETWFECSDTFSLLTRFCENSLWEGEWHSCARRTQPLGVSLFSVISWANLRSRVSSFTKIRWTHTRTHLQILCQQFL